MKTTSTCLAVVTCLQLFAQKNEQPEKIPFEGIDMTWQNGSDRSDSAIFSGKYFTPVIMLDVNYTYSFNDPIDNTVVGSTALARHNEIGVSSANIGEILITKAHEHAL